MSEAIKMRASVQSPQGNAAGDCSIYLLHSLAQLGEYDAV